MRRAGGIGFLGAGNMAEALLKGILSAGGASPRGIVAFDPVRSRLDEVARRYRIRPARSNREVAERSSVLVLAVKPKDVATALSEVSPAVERRHLLVSIAAGVRVATIRKVLGPSARIVRVMPNTPALVGLGAAGVFRGTGSPADVRRVLGIMQSVGTALEVPSERMMDAVTALSGSGPGFAFRIFEAFVRGARSLGFAPEAAKALTLQTFLGAARLAQGAPEPLEELRRRVTSPGGTTEAGLKVLETTLDPLVRGTLEAAFRRSIELGGRRGR